MAYYYIYIYTLWDRIRIRPKKGGPAALKPSSGEPPPHIGGEWVPVVARVMSFDVRWPQVLRTVLQVHAALLVSAYDLGIKGGQ